MLSGANSDGTAGLKIVKEFGGMALVQDPATAVVSFMPEAALANVDVDAVLKSNEMSEYINNLPQ